MKLLEGHDETVAQFVAGLSPIERPVFEPGYRAFGVIKDDGALVAGVVFSNWRKAFGTVELSGAALSRHCFRPRILVALGEHAFGKLGVFSVRATTALENRPALAMLEKLGFKGAVEAHWFGKGRHAMRLRLIKPDWERRWAPKEVARKAA